METQNEKSVPKEVGSNLTGTAITGKPGHERDIKAETFDDKPEKTEKDDDLDTSHLENTDSLLGDVHPTQRSEKSQEQHNADQKD